MRNPLAALFGGVSLSRRSVLAELYDAYLRGDGSGGGPISDDQALRVAAVMSCVRLIAATVGSLPLHVYRRLPDGGKERQPTNSLERVLNAPNRWQTPIEFREQLTAHLLLRGNAYAYVSWVRQVGRSGDQVDRVVELVPLHPDLVEVEQADWQSAPRYYLRRRTGGRLELPADEVLHIRGLSTDGVVGRSVLADARETLAVALDTQRYASRLFRNDATPGVVLRHPGRLTEPVAKRLRESWDEVHAGEARRTAVLEEGMTIERLTLSANDAQFLETRKFQRAEIAGLYMVPPHLIGDVDRSTSWGTGIESQQIAFLTYTIRPWLVRWEQAIRRVLLVADQTYFAEHLVEGMLRGDTKSRYDAYAIGRNWGWLSVNDIRAYENLNPVPNGDVYLQPLNMVEAGAPADPPDPEADPARTAARRAHELALAAATRPETHITVQAPPAPQVQVDARTTVAEGALRAETHVAPPAVTVHPPDVQAHVEVHQAKPGPVSKTFRRDARDLITEVLETPLELPAGAGE